MFKEIIDSLFNTANNFRKKHSKIKTIANCPKCGNLVIENEGVWGCIGKINGTCNFSMGLDIPNETKLSNNVSNNQSQSESENQKEIKTQSSIDNNTSIDKNNYQDNTKNQSNTNDNLKNNPKINTNKVSNNKASNNDDIVFRNGRKLSYKCSCGSDVYRYNKIAKCSNPKCKFTITTEYNSRNFNDIQLSELFGRRISPKLIFRNPLNEEEFEGRVFIDFDENLKLLPKYKFVSDINQLNKKYKENLFAPDKGKFKGLTLAEVEKKENASAKQNNKKIQSNNQKQNQKITQKTNNSKDNTQQKNIQEKNAPKKNISSNSNMDANKNKSTNTKIKTNTNNSQNKSVNTSVSTKNNNDYDYLNQDIYYQHYYNQEYTPISASSDVADDSYEEYLRANNENLNNYYNEESNYQYSSNVNYDDEPF